MCLYVCVDLTRASVCALPVVGAASEAGAGRGGPAGAAGGAAQGAGGEGKAGAHNHTAQAADGPVWHSGRQPLSSTHPFYRTPSCPLLALFLLLFLLRGPSGRPKVTPFQAPPTLPYFCQLSRHKHISLEQRRASRLLRLFFKLCISPSPFISVFNQ